MNADNLRLQPANESFEIVADKRGVATNQAPDYNPVPNAPALEAMLVDGW